MNLICEYRLRFGVLGNVMDGAWITWYFYTRYVGLP